MGLLTTTLRGAAFLVVLCSINAQEDEAYNPFLLSRARRSPQWQYAKSEATKDGGSTGDSSGNGGNTRFLSSLFGGSGLFGGSSNYDRPYYNRPGYGEYHGGGSGGSGNQFGFSFNYGQNNHYHRPGGYDHYDHHGYNDPHYDHHHHHPPPYRPRPPPGYYPGNGYGGGGYYGGGYGYGRSAAKADASAKSS